MKKNTLLTTIIIVIMALTSATPLVAMTQAALPTFSIGGIPVTTKDLVDFSLEATKAIQDISANKRNNLEQAIAHHQAKLQDLGRKKDHNAIGQAEYDLTAQTIGQKIQRLQQELDRHNSRNETIGDNVDKVMMSGWQAFLEHQREEQARKTQVAVAGVAKAVENEGSMERLQHMTNFLSDSNNLKKIGLFTVLTSTGVVGGYYALKYIYQYFKMFLGRPILVAESSYKGMWGDFYDYLFGSCATKEIFNDMILPAVVEDQLMQLAHATKQAHITGLPFRPILLYGQPGTGKTMFAKKLAYYSNMDYAIIPGGNLAQFKKGTDIIELNNLFRWAQKSKRGLILFFDEADAFLGKRADMTNEERERISTFLYHTSTSSDNVLIVLTTNRVNGLDTAVHSRMNKIIHMPLPNEQERLLLLKLYYDKYIANDTRTIVKDEQRVEAHITVEEALNLEATMGMAAKQLEGFSGRKIEQLVDELRSQCYYNNCILTQSLFDRILNEKIQEHNNLTKTLISHTP